MWPFRDYSKKVKAPVETPESCPDNAVCAYDFEGKLYKTREEIIKIKAQREVDKEQERVRKKLLKAVNYALDGPCGAYSHHLYMDDHFMEGERATRRIVSGLMRNLPAFLADFEGLVESERRNSQAQMSTVKGGDAVITQWNRNE